MTLDRLLAMAAIGFGTALAGLLGKYLKDTVGASAQSFIASRAANLGADMGCAEAEAAAEAAAAYDAEHVHQNDSISPETAGFIQYLTTSR